MNIQEELKNIIQSSNLSALDKDSLLVYFQKLTSNDQQTILDIFKADAQSLVWFNNNLKKRLELYKNKDMIGYKKFIEEEKNFLKSL